MEKNNVTPTLKSEVRDSKSEFTMFKSSIVEATTWNCGWKVVGACHGGNQKGNTFNLVKENFRIILKVGSPDSIEMYRRARTAPVNAVAKA